MLVYVARFISIVKSKTCVNFQPVNHCCVGGKWLFIECQNDLLLKQRRN